MFSDEPVRRARRHRRFINKILLLVGYTTVERRKQAYNWI